MQIFNNFDEIMSFAKKNFGKNDKKLADESFSRFRKGEMKMYKVQDSGNINAAMIKPGCFYTYIKNDSMHSKFNSIDESKSLIQRPTIGGKKETFSDKWPLIFWLGHVTVDKVINGVNRKEQYGVAIDLNLVPRILRLVLFDRLSLILSQMYSVNIGKTYGAWKMAKGVEILLKGDDGNGNSSKRNLAESQAYLSNLINSPIPIPCLMVIREDEVNYMKAIDWSELFNILYLNIPTNLKFRDGYKITYYTENLFKKGPKPKKMIIQ